MTESSVPPAPEPADAPSAAPIVTPESATPENGAVHDAAPETVVFEPVAPAIPPSYQPPVFELPAFHLPALHVPTQAEPTVIPQPEPQAFQPLTSEQAEPTALQPPVEPTVYQPPVEPTVYQPPAQPTVYQPPAQPTGYQPAPLPPTYQPPTYQPAAPTSAPAYSGPPPGYPAGYPPPGYPQAGYPQPGYPQLGAQPPYPGAQPYPGTPPTQPWAIPAQRSPWGDVPASGVPFSYPPNAAPPYPYQYPVFAPPVRKRRRWPLWTGLSVFVVALIVACGAVVFSNLSDNTVANGPATPGAQTPSPSASAPPTQPPPPDPTTLNGQLVLQSDALMSGDLKGFLAAVDPKSKSAVAEFTRIFHNMRVMHVARWSAESSDGYVEATAAAAGTEMNISYCLVVTSCTSTSQSLHIWQKMIGGKSLISGVTVPKSNKYEYGPVPWLVSTLSAVTGPRVVVAASSAEASHLASVLPMAERSVANADKYAHWGKPPVYVLYLANHTEGNKTWFGVSMHNTLGLSMPLDTTDIQVMILMPDANIFNYTGPGLLESVIRHEFGHVATLQSDNYNSDDSFVEGIAQYISLTGHPTWDKYDRMATKQYIRSGKWSKKILLTKEIRSSDLLTSNAAYEIGYLGLRYLVSKYGLEKMLTFWGDVEQNSQSPETASKAVFGTSWTSVNAAAVTYVKHAVGA